MKPRIALSFLFLLAGPQVLAADGTDTEASVVDAWTSDPSMIFDAKDVDLADFKWIARPVIVFADAPLDPAFREQMELLQSRTDELVERDVILIVDTTPDRDSRSDLRREMRPRGFMLTLVGKDGGVKLRKPFPWNVRELSRQIDKMPIRQKEIRDGLSGE